RHGMVDLIGHRRREWRRQRRPYRARLSVPSRRRHLRRPRRRRADGERHRRVLARDRRRRGRGLGAEQHPQRAERLRMPVRVGGRRGGIDRPAPRPGCPCAPLTSTAGGNRTPVPAGPAWLVALFAASVAAAPAVPVAVNVTGLPESDPEVAVNVFEPAVALSVQLPTVATPLALVVWLPPVIVPFPGATANVTATPATGFPFASFTSTDGGEHKPTSEVQSRALVLFAA